MPAIVIDYAIQTIRLCTTYTKFSISRANFLAGNTKTNFNFFCICYIHATSLIHIWRIMLVCVIWRRQIWCVVLFFPQRVCLKLFLPPFGKFLLWLCLYTLYITTLFPCILNIQIWYFIQKRKLLFFLLVFWSVLCCLFTFNSICVYVHTVHTNICLPCIKHYYTNTADDEHKANKLCVSGFSCFWWWSSFCYSPTFVTP